MNQEPTEPVTIPDFPDFLTPKREARSNSTGKDITRSSPSPLPSNEKPIPHYLRASAGSCHDYCKYGRKHASEDKARRPNFRRSSGDNEISEKIRNQVEVPPRGGRKKKPLQKLKPTSQYETELSGLLNVVKNKGLSAAKDIWKCEYGSEGFLSSSQNSISSTDPRYSDRAEGLSEEHVSIESIGPSVVEKSVITNELIVSTQEDVLLEEHMSVVMPSSGQGSAASEAGGLYGELHEAVSPLRGSVVGFADSTLTSQEVISGGMPISNLSDTLSHASSRRSPGNQAVKPSGEPIKASPSSSQSIKARSSKTSDSNRREVPKLRSMPKQKNEMPVKAKVIAQKETDVSGKSSIIKQKAPSVNKKTMTSDQQKTIKQKSPNTASSVTAEVLKLKASSPLKKIDVSARASASLKPKASATKSLSPLTPAGAPNSSRSKPSQISRTQDLPKTLEKKVLKLPRASLSPKVGDKKVLKTLRASLSPKIGEKKVVKTPRASLSPKIGEKKVLKTARASLSLNIGGDKKVLKAPRVFLSPRPAVTRISSMKLRKFGNKKLGSPVKNAKKVSAQDNNDQVKEKTICAIDPEPEIKSEEDVPQKSTDYKLSTSSQSLSVTSSQSTASDTSHENEENEDTESSYTEVSEVVSEDEGTESDNEVESEEVEERRMSRKKSVVHPGDEAQPPHKLKFRRGKVLDPQSEKNGPRRLRFRKPRVVTESENGRGELGRRSFRKRSIVSGVDTNEVPEAPNVVLRHQDQQGKKDTQGLFNHVIEETASKLVESRKSKVKALVGAFETVISLQDTKAATTV
ncbi:putative Calmodulin-binding domain, plant [Dioscorea sansibarensis]